MSSADTSIGQGGTFGNGPAGVNAYDTSPSGLGMNPTYLAPGAVATASVSGSSGSVVALASFPPSSPTDGQTVILELPSTYDPVGGKKIRWAFAYNVADAVWNFIGGPGLYAEVQTSESTASAVYVDLATAGPAITLPRPGDYTIAHGFRESGASTGIPVMSYAIGAGAASDNDFAVAGAASHASVSRQREKTGLAATTITAKYQDASGSGASVFEKRWIAAKPVRIT